MTCRRLLSTAVVCCALGVTGAAQAQNPEAAPKSIPQAPTASAKAPTTPVNLNTATLVQLESLPGIGAKVAARIKEYREKNGAFKKTEELMNVRGIGEKAFLRIRSLVTVAPAKPEAGSGQHPQRHDLEQRR